MSNYFSFENLKVLTLGMCSQGPKMVEMTASMIQKKKKEQSKAFQSKWVSIESLLIEMGIDRKEYRSKSKKIIQLFLEYSRIRV